MMNFEFRKPKFSQRKSTKVCLVCRVEKDVYREFRWNRASDGEWPVGRCKECLNKYQNEYRASRRTEKIYQKNKPTLVCRDCGIEKDTKTGFYNCHQPCRVCFVAKCVKKRQTPEGKARRKAEYAKNMQPAKDRAKRWRIDNPERCRELRLAWVKTDKGKKCEWEKVRRRRATILGAVTEGEKTITKDWFEELKAQHNHRCYYCWESSLPLTMDHVTPLARGGKHVRSNMLPSCKPCNSRKSDKLISEWRPWIDIPLYGLELASA